MGFFCYNRHAFKQLKMNASTLKILIVEDDHGTARFLETVLENEGWSAEAVENGSTALEKVKSQAFDLALVDLHLPGTSGWDLLKKLKADPRTAQMPCFLMTAKYLLDEDICRGLSEGADDYLFKPISREVLVAKIKAHMRRLKPNVPASGSVYSKRGLAGALSLHIPTRSVTLHDPACAQFANHRRCGFPQCKEITLTKTEFDILTFFMTAKSAHVFSRRDILEGVWRDSSLSVSPDVVDKHVESLRKKLKKIGQMIKTVYGVGYTFEEEGHD